jgi:RNA polymerase sigma factor, sigma-70 family
MNRTEGAAAATAITPSSGVRTGWGVGKRTMALPTRVLPNQPVAPRADPDLLLVRQHLAGDPTAFETLFRKYQTPIYNMVVRMVRGEDAYDITQEVFLKALRALKSFRGDSKFSTWLYTIARHTCLNHLRHKAVLDEESLQEQQEEHPGNEPVDLDMNVNRLAETRELQRVVDAVLATMPTEARLLLVLRDFEQLSYDEISQVTELSIVNVKSKIHRARQAFKKRFQPYLELLEGGIGR